MLTLAQSRVRLAIIERQNLAAARPCPDLHAWLETMAMVGPESVVAETSAFGCVPTDSTFFEPGDVVEYANGLLAVVITPDVLMLADDTARAVRGSPAEWSLIDDE